MTYLLLYFFYPLILPLVRTPYSTFPPLISSPCYPSTCQQTRPSYHTDIKKKTFLLDIVKIKLTKVEHMFIKITL